MTSRVIIADASRVSPREFLDHVLGPRLPEPLRIVAWLRSQGNHQQADTYLEAVNRCRRIAGAPEFVETAEIVQLEARPLGGGRYGVAA